MFRLPWQKPNASREEALPHTSQAASQASAPEAQTLYAARQPILGRDAQVAGYELLFRRGPENRFDGTDADLASATTIEQSASVFGLDALIGDSRAFVNLSRGALLAGHHRFLPRERTVVELLENIEPTAEVLQACRQLREEGYTVALDDYTGTPESQPFLELVQIVKVDLRGWPAGYDPAELKPLKQRGVQLLAEKVETPQEHALARAAGYDMFQGYYYCRPQMMQTRDVPPAKLSVLRFMAELSREDVDMDKLEAVFRQDVGMSVRLLRYLNSAAFGWRHEVNSIGHALSLMGQRPLRKWAMLMGMVSLCDDRPKALAVNALSRARFAERIGAPLGMQANEHELFLTGMLSLVDTMVGRPMAEVLAGLSVPASVRAALVDHAAPLAPVLGMVTAYERGDWAAVDMVRHSIPVDERMLDEAYVDSVQWAEATVAA